MVTCWLHLVVMSCDDIWLQHLVSMSVTNVWFGMSGGDNWWQGPVVTSDDVDDDKDDDVAEDFNGDEDDGNINCDIRWLKT